MLLVLSAIWMKDSQTDRHKRAFWDLLQLQEAASLSKFATWHWWSACLPMWYVSLHMCTSGRSRKHNWECVQRLESCLTTSLVCLCPCALRLPSALLPLLASPPLSVWLSLLTGHIGKQVEERSQGTDITQALCSVSGADQCAGWRYAPLSGDKGESRDYSLHRSESFLGPGCTVSLPVELALCLSVRPVMWPLLFLFFYWFVLK